MQFDFKMAPSMSRYELLLSCVLPRPVAIITTLNADGTVNAAPYSLFNVIGHEPPLVAVSVLPHPDRRLKDTGANILARNQFVLNMVSEGIAEGMNVTCIDAPPGIAELQFTALTTTASTGVAPPRIAESPAAFECEFVTSLAFGANQALVIGRILHAHVADDVVRNAATGEIDAPALKLIGAMHAAKWYARMTDRFAMDRPTWAGWKSAEKV